MALLCWFQNRRSSVQPRPPDDSCVFAQLRKYDKPALLYKSGSLHVISMLIRETNTSTAHEHVSSPKRVA